MKKSNITDKVDTIKLGGRVIKQLSDREGEILACVFPDADEEVGFAHHFRDSVPNDFKIVKMTKPGTVYRGTTVWNKAKIYLVSSVNNNTTTLVLT